MGTKPRQSRKNTRDDDPDFNPDEQEQPKRKRRGSSASARSAKRNRERAQEAIEQVKTPLGDFKAGDIAEDKKATMMMTDKAEEHWAKIRDNVNKKIKPDVNTDRAIRAVQAVGFM